MSGPCSKTIIVRSEQGLAQTCNLRIVIKHEKKIHVIENTFRDEPLKMLLPLLKMFGLGSSTSIMKSHA